MVSEDAKVKALCDERDGLRRESTEMQKGTHRIVFAVVTIVGVAAGLYFGTNTQQLATRPALLFLLTQLQFLLGLLGALLISNQVIHASYIQSLERKINDLVGDERFSIWESSVTAKYLMGPSGVSFWIHIVLYVYLAGVFVLLVYFAYEFFNNFVSGAILTIELLLLLVVYARAALQRKGIQNHLRSTQQQ